MTTPEQTIHAAAEQAGCKAEIVQETALKWCNTWQTYMPHIWTSQGWQCPCGELNTEGTDNTLRGSLEDAGFGPGIL